MIGGCGEGGERGRVEGGVMGRWGERGGVGGDSRV